MGSEMCIRDSGTAGVARQPRAVASPAQSAAEQSGGWDASAGGLGRPLALASSRRTFLAPPPAAERSSGGSSATCERAAAPQCGAHSAQGVARPGAHASAPWVSKGLSQNEPREAGAADAGVSAAPITATATACAAGQAGEQGAAPKVRGEALAKACGCAALTSENEALAHALMSVRAWRLVARFDSPTRRRLEGLALERGGASPRGALEGASAHTPGTASRRPASAEGATHLHAFDYVGGGLASPASALGRDATTASPRVLLPRPHVHAAMRSVA